MTQQEFSKHFFELLDKDSPKGSSTSSRTFLNSEAEKLAQHLYEWICPKMDGFSTDVLCSALLKTRGKYLSEQDRAAAIMKIIEKE